MIEYHVLNTLEDAIVEASGLSKDEIHAIGIDIELDGTLVCWINRHPVVTTHRKWLGRVSTEISYREPPVKVTLSHIQAIMAQNAVKTRAYIDRIKAENRAQVWPAPDTVSPEDNER